MADSAVYFVVDRLQAGMLGPYGNTWIQTPQFNRLASESVVADFAFAERLRPEETLEVLWSAKGMIANRAVLITDDAAIAEHPRAAAFAETRLVEPPRRAAAAKLIEETHFAAFIAAAAEELERATEPFTLWLHTRGMVGAWDAPYELREQYADEEDPAPPKWTVPPERLLTADHDPDELLGIVHAYAGQVTLLDACLGVLLDAMEESPLAASTDFALIGLRGYPLGEHLRVGECDAALYNERLHVPLMWRRRSDGFAPDRNLSLLTHADLPQLLLGDAEFTPRRDYLQFFSNENRAIRTQAWFLRESGPPENPRHELYVKPDDRWEVNDVAGRCPEIVSQLAAVLADPRPRTEPLAELLTTVID